MDDTTQLKAESLSDHALSPEQALAQSEERFRKVVEALPDAILVYCDGKIVFVNPFCVRMLRAQAPEELLGKDLYSIVAPERLSSVAERIEACYRTGESSPPLESVMVACDGSTVPIEAVAIPTSWDGAPAIEVVARDIRKRRQAEQHAYEWQKRLELAQKSGLRIGLWEWNLTDNTVAWSDETYRQFGYSADDFSGKVEDALTRIHPEDRPRVHEAILKMLTGGGDYACQYRLVRPDGSICWLDARGVLVGDGASHVLGVGVDITELKLAQQALQESEENYLLLLNSTAEAIFGADLEGTCTFCNAAGLRLLGYDSPEQLLGKKMHEVSHHTRADGTPFPIEECAVARAISSGQRAHVVDDVFWDVKGNRIPVEYRSYPLHRHGELVGAVVSCLDISERKRSEQSLRQSEEKYRNLFENATYGLFCSNVEGDLLDVNPALVDMLGYTSRDELLSRNLVRDVYEVPSVRTLLLRESSTRNRVDGIEVNWRRKNGSIVAVKMSAGVVREVDGSIHHFEVIVEDITGHKALEEQFRQSQKMEAVGLLAAGISHDFNNLMSVILGNAEFLDDAAHNSQERHYAEEIKKAARRAAQLTRQLLAFSSKQVLCPTILDVNAIVSEMAKLLHRVLGEDVQVVLDLAPELGSVRADRGQLEQILMNLATNARDAMPAGGTLTLRTANAELTLDDVARDPEVKPGPYLRLSVSDTGVGMSPEVRARVFEPFFTTKARGRGTGLGLATVYGAVKQSNGYVWISSAPGAGSIVDIFLPQGEQKMLPIESHLDLESKEPYDKGTILLLEDDEPLQRMTHELLVAGGYNVLRARSGQHAIDLVRQFQGSIPVVVCALVLGDIYGPTAVEKLQLLHPEMRAVYISGYTVAPAHQKPPGDDAVLLQKPVPRKELLQAVADLLKKAKAAHA